MASTIKSLKKIKPTVAFFFLLSNYDYTKISNFYKVNYIIKILKNIKQVINIIILIKVLGQIGR